MNDGLMMPFDEARFQAYQIGCSRLKAAADSAKSKIVFITPPVFQGDADKKAEYDAVLDKYAEWLISQKNSGWQVIDIRPGLRSRIAEAKTKNPGFRYSGDGVHPGSLGHHMIAQEVINGLVSELGLAHKVMEKEHRPTSETLKKHEDIRNEWLIKTKHARPGVPGYDPEMAKQQLPKMISTWNGFIREEFVIGGRRAWIVFPRNAGELGKKQLWIWCPQFFDYKPIADLELLKRGFALAFISMEDLYGSPKSMEIMDQFYKYLVNERNFAPKTVLIGLSRGGLYSLNWAEKNPQYVAGIYVDAPVCDFKSWPGGKCKGNGSSADWEKCLKAYGFTEEEALAYQGNPVDNMSKMAKAGVPLLFISRTEDNEVPIEENTDIFAKRYAKLGAPVRVIRRPGGHLPRPVRGSIAGTTIPGRTGQDGGRILLRQKNLRLQNHNHQITIMFSYISEGEPSEYGFLPAGVYEGKIVKMEEGISQGAKTRGCPQLAVHIRAFGPEGAATVRYYLTNSKDLAWKIDLFVKNVTGNVYQPGQQVIINPAEYLGKPCYVRLSVRQGDQPRADGTYPEFSNCEDVLGPDEARAIMAAQDRAAAGRGGASLPPRPADLPANNHMSATAGPPAEGDEIPF